MSATQTLAVEKILVKHNFTEQEATQILDYVDSQRGDAATKQFVSQETGAVRKDLKQEIDTVRKDLKQEIDTVRKDLKQEIDTVRKDLKQEIKGVRNELMSEIDGIKRDMNWLKWIVGLGFTIGFGSLLTIILYLHSDTKAIVLENQKLILQLIQRK